MKFNFKNANVMNFQAGPDVVLKDEKGTDVSIAGICLVGLFRQIPNDQAGIDVQVKKYRIAQKLLPKDVGEVDLESEEQTIIKNCVAFMGPLIAGQVADFFEVKKAVV